MSSAIAGLIVAIGVGIGVLAASIVQRSRYQKAHQEHLARMAHLRRMTSHIDRPYQRADDTGHTPGYL